MNKKIKMVTMFLSLVVCTFAFNVYGEQQLGSDHTQNFHIVKYGLNSSSENFANKQTNNNGQIINGIPTDDHNNELSPVEGIKYSIQKIIPKNSSEVDINDSSSYDTEGEPIILITNVSGLADQKLVDGYYIISEFSNKEKGLTKVASPVLYRLPVVNENKDGYLNDVYYYPKSSIDKDENNEVPPTTSNSSKKEGDNDSVSGSLKNEDKSSLLPKTGEKSTILFVIIGLMLITVVGITLLRRKGDRAIND